MGLGIRREDLRAPITTDPTEGHREPVPQVEDELGLLGHLDETPVDQLARLDLSSKPEDYFSGDPRHFHHEVL